MENALETIEKDGYTLSIYLDDCPESPRDWDNVGKLYIPRPPRGYTLSDKDASADECDAAPVKLPVYILDHSGLAISTGSFGDPWDSWRAGVIYVTADTLKSEYLDHGYTMEKAIKAARACIQGEIEVFNDYIQGNVYGYTIETDYHAVTDSCWGYYGDDGIKEIHDIFADFIKREKQREIEQARAAAIEAAPLFVWGKIDPVTLQAVNA